MQSSLALPLLPSPFSMSVTEMDRGCPCRHGFRSWVVRLLVLSELSNFYLLEQSIPLERLSLLLLAIRDPRREPWRRDTIRHVDGLRREQVEPLKVRLHRVAPDRSFDLRELLNDRLRRDKPTDDELVDADNVVEHLRPFPVRTADRRLLTDVAHAPSFKMVQQHRSTSVLHSLEVFQCSLRPLMWSPFDIHTAFERASPPQMLAVAYKACRSRSLRVDFLETPRQRRRAHQRSPIGTHPTTSISTMPRIPRTTPRWSSNTVSPGISSPKRDNPRQETRDDIPALHQHLPRGQRSNPRIVAELALASGGLGPRLWYADRRRKSSPPY